jgi:vacuolar-type H+-ATPase subunit E/Vma4
MTNGDTSGRPAARLAEALAEQARQIRQIEEQAEEALHAREDTAEYKARLEDKARLLSGLPDSVRELLQELPGDERDRVKQRLQAFAGNAEQALSLESVFFMRLLLYPEDYQEGQDNDLEALVRSLEPLLDQ